MTFKKWEYTNLPPGKSKQENLDHEQWLYPNFLPPTHKQTNQICITYR